MSVFDSLHRSSASLLDKVDAHFDHFQPLNSFSQRISVRPAYLLVGFFLVGVVLVGAGIFSHLFVAVFGMIYPSYMTFKALNSGDSCRTKEWLTYWIVFGFFTAFARTARYFFFFLSLSSYNVFRILLYLYLFHPATNGAAFLYNNYLRNKLVEIKEYLDHTHSKQ